MLGMAESPEGAGNAQILENLVKELRELTERAEKALEEFDR